MSAINLYVMSTVFHLLSGLLDIQSNQEDSILVLVSNYPDDFQFFCQIKPRLESFPKVKNVVVLAPRKGLKRFLSYRSELVDVKPSNINRVVVFPWNLHKVYTNANYILKKYGKGATVDLFEDGFNVYLSAKQPYSFLKKAAGFLMGVLSTRKAVSHANRVMVSLPNEYPKYIQDKATQRSITELINHLPQKEREQILEVFLDREQRRKIERLALVAQKNVLFTQPLARDGFMTSEEQRSLYNELIDRYSDPKQFLIIKKHPRDLMTYKTNVNCTVIAGKVPSEILRVLGLEFTKSIGVNSSATRSVSALEYVEKTCD